MGAIQEIRPEQTVWIVTQKNPTPTPYVVDAVIPGFVSVRAVGSLHYTVPMDQIVAVDDGVNPKDS